MLTRGLVALMRRAESPTAIMTAAFLLEKATGLSTKNIIDETAFSFTEGGQRFRESDWLQRNGYNRLAAALGGYSSYTGRTISPESAVELAALYGGVKIIAEDMGTLPCFVYRRGPNRTTERDYTHPLYQALHDLPNPEIGAGEFVEMLTAHAVLGLDGFARIDRIGRRIYLWPLVPPNVRTDRSARGALVYIVREPKGSEVTYERDRIFHLRGMMLLNDARGDEVLKRARHVLGLGLAGQEYVGRFYANDASPGVIITRPVGSALLGAEKMLEVKEAWMRWHQGLRRAHEPAILEAGAQAMRLDPDHQKLQLLEARKFAVIEVCRILRISPHKLADLDRATFSNIEQLNIDHVTHTLSAWVRRWRQAIYRCLLTESEQLADSLYAEHEVAALLKGDFKTQSDGFRALLEKGVFSINEVRRLMNLNPVEGGDEHFIQLNMATVQDVATGAALSGKDLLSLSGGRAS